MTLNEIYSLENVTVTEDTYYVHVTPDCDYRLEINDGPVTQRYYTTIEMFKQDRYPDIRVVYIYDPSVWGADPSVLVNSSIYE